MRWKQTIAVFVEQSCLSLSQKSLANAGYLHLTSNDYRVKSRMNALFEHLPNWLTHPALIRWGEALLGLVLILFVFGVMRGLLAKRITVPETRYHTRKMITFISYFAAAIYIAGLFSDSLGQLTVVFGVVGESIAFALQEVIASFAGWVAISIGQFYRPGDHVLLGGVMGNCAARSMPPPRYWALRRS